MLSSISLVQFNSLGSQLVFGVLCVKMHNIATEISIGRQLKLKRSLENEFCSTTLGTSFSLLFCLANNPNNAMLKVLHCIPCSFGTISA